MDASFGADLQAAQRMWCEAEVMAAAGSLVLLTYFAIPGLLAVRPVGGSLRTAVDGHREREFLQAVLGLTGNSLGGVSNPAVRVRTRTLAQRHRGYPGMQDVHMDFIAGLIALAPLLVTANRGPMPPNSHQRRESGGREGVEQEAYWRYMRRFAGLLGCDLASPAQTERLCEQFTERHARSDPAGRELIAGFGVRHREHVRRAVPALFPPARRVVRAALG